MPHMLTLGSIMPPPQSSQASTASPRQSVSAVKPLVPGTIDLYAQPRVKNPDGSISTVDSIGINIDGKEYLLSTVTKDGRHFVGPNAADQAVREFKRTGQHLGVFSSIEDSNRYAEQLHKDYESGKYDKRP